MVAGGVEVIALESLLGGLKLILGPSVGGEDAQP